MDSRCRAETKSGKRCSRKARERGYCSQHKPEENPDGESDSGVIEFLLRSEEVHPDLKRILKNMEKKGFDADGEDMAKLLFSLAMKALRNGELEPRERDRAARDYLALIPRFRKSERDGPEPFESPAEIFELLNADFDDENSRIIDADEDA